MGDFITMDDFARISLLETEDADASVLFTASMSAFRDTLSDSDRASWQQCSTATAMIQELEALCSKHARSNQVTACLKKIKAFSDSFEPFFDIINIFVQVKPEWFGLFWGTIRLIFKVSLLVFIL